MPDTISRLTASQAAGLVSLFGLVLTLVPLVHLFQHQQSVLSAGIGVGIPILVALSIVAGGIRLIGRGFDVRCILRIVRWMSLGLLAGTVTGIGIIAHLSVLEYTVTEAPFLAANTGITGAAGGFLIGYYEVTGRQRTALIEQNNARFKAVFEGTHDALVIADDDGTYVDANPAAASLFGVDVETLIGMSIRDFAARDFDFDTEWSAFRQEQHGRGQFPLVRPDGTKRIVEFAATSEVYPGHHLSALRDVTERVHYEQEIEHQRETLSFLNQILRHNVLNGVHVIHGRAGFLAETVDDDESDHVGAIRDRSVRIADLVSRMSQLNSTMWSGDSLEQFNVCDTLVETVDATRSSFPEARVDIETWPSEAVFVTADPMLQEVFDNLLVNAIVHNDAATPEVTIDISTAEDSVSISITDNGPGIPEATKQRIVGPDDTGPTSDGTGFGLYIVNTLVDRYDGTIDILDNDPRGSIFTITFPRVDHLTAAA